MSEIEYSVVTSDVIKSFDCIYYKRDGMVYSFIFVFQVGRDSFFLKNQFI